MKQTFEQWFAKVDMEVKKIASISVNDLPDCPYYDWYENRVSPLRAAKRALKGLYN